MDEYERNRALDKAKSTVFLGTNAAFLGSLLAGLNFNWTTNIPTACTDGKELLWNPTWFEELSADMRCTVLMHELWHCARLHPVRRGDRDPEYWNYACDIRINNDLENQGYTFDIDSWKDHAFDANGIAAEEDIYDILMQQKRPPPSSWSAGDLQDMTPEQASQLVNSVVQAMEIAKAAGQPGSIPGDVELIIKKFLDPVVPWQSVLQNFFQEMLNEDFSWKKPNRRYQDIYLPSRFTDDGRLESLDYYLDVSGSITNNDVLRFNSEVKYVKEQYNPEKLTLIQFDTEIRQIREFNESDPFDEVVVVGRGGTCLIPVRDLIIERKPTAAIIFTDLRVTPMQPLPFEIPIIWIGIRASGYSVPFGKLIHIR